MPNIERSPEQFRKIDYLSTEGKKIGQQPHIDVWQSHPGPHKFLDTANKYKINQDWYVSMGWEEKDKKGNVITGFIPLTDWDTKVIISRCAVLIGKELNIPVIRHEIDIVLLWKPEKRLTKAQRDWINYLTRQGNQSKS
jgi:hypothetical protein